LDLWLKFVGADDEDINFSGEEQKGGCYIIAAPKVGKQGGAHLS